jgi:hypothetical protein
MASTNSLLTAHIVVQFADTSANVSIVAEVDDREDGYNAGKTSFYHGDTPHLLLFLPSGYEVDQVIPSAGTVSFIADDVKEVEGYLSFPNEDTASVSYPITSDWTYAWLGTSLGAISVADQFTASLPPRGFDTVNKKPIPEYRVGIASSYYKSACKVYKLSSVPPTVTQVMVFFVVKKSP